MLPAPLLINLAALVLYLLGGLLDKQALLRFLKIDADAVFLISGDRLVILGKVIAEKA